MTFPFYTPICGVNLDRFAPCEHLWAPKPCKHTTGASRYATYSGLEATGDRPSGSTSKTQEGHRGGLLQARLTRRGKRGSLQREGNNEKRRAVRDRSEQ